MELSRGLLENVGKVREDVDGEEEVRGGGGRLRGRGGHSGPASNQDRGLFVFE